MVLLKKNLNIYYDLSILNYSFYIYFYYITKNNKRPIACHR